MDENTIRLTLFFSILIAMLCWEYIAPRREFTGIRGERWITNLGLSIINSLLLRLIFPAAAVTATIWAQDQSFGVFNQWHQVPSWVAIVATIMLLDLAIYAQHVVSHKVPLLWRLHRVHHADTAFDVTTGIRFHPIEILLSMAYKVTVVALLGASPEAVIIYEIILSSMALFNHGNVNLPTYIDQPLRLFFVTPDMHRIHHSDAQKETDSNYGNFLPWWDYLFKTYRPEPGLGQTKMVIGLKEYPEQQARKLHWNLLLPFRKK